MPVSANVPGITPPVVNASAFSRLVTAAVTAAGATILAFEIGFLFCSVCSRYLLNRPIIWADECASTGLVWLAAMGAVLAYRRGAHMQMLALTSRVSDASRSRFQGVALAGETLLFAVLLWPAISYAADEASVTTQALGISDAWRAAALPAAIALLLLSAVERQWEPGRWRDLRFGVVVIAFLAVSLLVAQPLLAAFGMASLVLFFLVGALGMVVLGIPIAFAFGLATVAYLLVMTAEPLSVVVNRMDEAMSQFSLLAVPLFVFLGLLMGRMGLARALIHLLASLFGHFRSGLSYVLVGAMYLVSGISGSKAADLAAIAPALVPEMAARGERRSDLLALLAATAAQTETVPPSLVLITVGSVTGISVAALFKGGLLPSLFLGALLCCAIALGGRSHDRQKRERATARAVGRAALHAAPALILPLVIRIAVTSGVATGTEVAAIGVVYTLAIGSILYERVPWRDFGPLLADTASLSGAILLVIGMSNAMGWALTISGFSAGLADAIALVPGGRYAFLLASIVIFAVFGCLLEGIPAIVLFGPLLFPVARHFGVNDVHYAMVAVVSMGIGLFAPPFGVGYYLAASISGTDPSSAIKATLRYLLWLGCGVLAIALVPSLSTALL